MTHAIAFEPGSATIGAQSFCVLDALVALLRDNPGVTLDVKGHTDGGGDAAANQSLSQRRADSVRSYLVIHGIEPARLRAIGSGGTEPLVPNDTDAHRVLNRRIELLRTETPLTCDTACARVTACGIDYARDCTQHCAGAGTLPSCAASAGTDCTAIAVCVQQQWARQACGNVGGYAGYADGSASCEEVSTCEGACGGSEACACACRARAQRSKALPLVKNEVCYLESCQGQCGTPGGQQCSACWLQHCGASWAASCKDN